MDIFLLLGAVVFGSNSYESVNIENSTMCPWSTLQEKQEFCMCESGKYISKPPCPQGSSGWAVDMHNQACQIGPKCPEGNCFQIFSINPTCTGGHGQAGNPSSCGYSYSINASPPCPNCHYFEPDPPVTGGKNMDPIECTHCEKGTYQDQNNTLKCKPCPSGSYSNEMGLSKCTSCSGGKYQNEEAQTSCISCPVGYQSMDTRNNCQPCPQGKYQNQTGEERCISCEIGKYQDSFGQTVCLSEGCVDNEGFEECQRLIGLTAQPAFCTTPLARSRCFASCGFCKGIKTNLPCPSDSFRSTSGPDKGLCIHTSAPTRAPTSTKQLFEDTYKELETNRKDMDSHIVTLTGLFVGLTFLLLASVAVLAVFMRRIKLGTKKLSYDKDYSESKTNVICSDDKKHQLTLA